jgi:DinB superfamily
LDVLKEHLVNSLKGGQASVPVEQALKNITPSLRNVKSNEKLHTIWQELEHLRITQEDILQYMINPDWVSPKWPDGYWPQPVEKLTDQIWDSTYAGFFNDLNSVIDLTQNPELNILEIIPHAKIHTYLREITIIIEHNAYHIGKIIDIRKALGDW